MNPRLPTLLFFGGVLACAISLASKQLFLETLGRSYVLNWSCGLLGAFLFSAALFLSLYGLLVCPMKRGELAMACLGSLFAYLALLSLSFSEYVVFANVTMMRDEVPNVLSKLVENARTMNSEEKRVKMARGAYELYGVKLAYRREGGDFTYYEPTAQEIADHSKLEHDSARNAKLWELIIKGQLLQLPYLFAFYIGAFFLTFSMGSLWIFLKKAPALANLQL